MHVLFLLQGDNCACVTHSKQLFFHHCTAQVNCIMAQEPSEDLVKVNKILKSNPSDANALLERAKIYTRTKELNLALADAEKATQLTRGRSDCQLRRAICLWRLHRYGEAKSLVSFFARGQEEDTWRQLIINREEPEIDVPKIPGEQPADSHNLENQQINTGSQDTITIPAQNSGHSSHRSSQHSIVHGTVPVAPKVDWFQTKDIVEIVLYKKDLPADTEITIAKTSLSVTSNNFQWSQVLGNEIDPEKSTFRTTRYKVEFNLVKVDATTHWISLDAEDEPAMDTPAVAATTTQDNAQLVTSYDKWEQLSLSDDEKAEDEGDADEFFRKLYKDADPDVRRAMMKSYVESNGTALSTNWKDVKDKKVETVPPEDMVAKDWD